MQQQTMEIPTQAWSLYLDELEQQLHGRAVRVEVVGEDLGDQPLVKELPLRGLELNEKGSGSGTIELELGEDGEFDHFVLHPTHIFAQATRRGVERLDIEDAEHHKTLITFDRPVPIVVDDLSRRVGPVSVRDYMSPQPGTILRGLSVADAYEVMMTTGGRHVPVVDEEGRAIGVLSDRDLFLTKGNKAIDPERVTVDEVMTPDPYTVSADTPLDEAAQVMAERRFGCAVVVANERVIGILTTVDTLRALVDRLRGPLH